MKKLHMAACSLMVLILGGVEACGLGEEDCAERGTCGTFCAGAFRNAEGEWTCPETETCNDIDDDGDGKIDNGDPGGGVPCDTGRSGVCAQGTTTCLNGNIICKDDVVQGTPEVCNDLDDDCNGIVDDSGNCGCKILGQACSPFNPQDCCGGTVCRTDVNQTVCVFP